MEKKHCWIERQTEDCSRCGGTENPLHTSGCVSSSHRRRHQRRDQTLRAFLPSLSDSEPVSDRQVIVLLHMMDNPLPEQALVYPSSESSHIHKRWKHENHRYLQSHWRSVPRSGNGKTTSFRLTWCQEEAYRKYPLTPGKQTATIEWMRSSTSLLAINPSSWF